MSRIIVIEAGHGGRDPGAVGNGLREKDLNLRLLEHIRSEATRAGVIDNFRFVRDTDVDMNMTTRNSQIVSHNPHLIVSLHCNAFNQSSANGFETWINNETIRPLATRIHNQVFNYHNSHTRTADRGVRRNGHNGNLGLMPNHANTVLFEHLFMTNPEILRMNDDNYLRGLARAIISATLEREINFNPQVAATPDLSVALGLTQGQLTVNTTLRAEPRSNANPIRSVRAGVIFERGRREGEWFFIRLASGEEGWVRTTTFRRGIGRSLGFSEGQTTRVVQFRETARTNNTNIIRALPVGQMVQLGSSGHTNEFWRVRVHNVTGFVRRNAVRL